MNVFILCTGRCGSTTLIKACQHMTNYTAKHESRTRKIGVKRLKYPDNHIEGDNRLSWYTGSLDEKYGDAAFYVHLTRQRDATASSYAKRYYRLDSIMDAFSKGVKKFDHILLNEEERLAVCYEYIDTSNANIRFFLSNKSNVMHMTLENISEDFKKLWNLIGAKGDLESALLEIKIKHNANSQRKLKFFRRIRLFVTREWRHYKMWWLS